MWDNSGTRAARKRQVQKARSNRTTATLAAVTLCAALVVSGCGSGSGASHGSHAVATSASGSDGHAGHGASDDAAGSGNGSAHDGHEARDNASNSDPAGSHGDHGSHSSGGGQDADSASAYMFEFNPGHPAAGEPFAIDMNIADGDGKAIEKFDITHEKLMHLIVVSEDLSQFYHLHPAYDGQSGFHQEMELPKGGAYRLFADYKPAGEASVTATGSVHVAGEESSEPLVPDTGFTKQVDGMNVSLAFTTLKAGENAELTFSFEDAATGEAVADLEPYLGAIGHVVIVGEGAQNYLHVHAENDNGSGPEATFATQFPERGLYRIWGQFQRNGTLTTVSYTVKAE